VTRTDTALHRPASADGLGLGGLLSIGVHAALIAALALSVQWRRHTVQPVTAELWSAVPQAAAPAPAAAAEPPEIGRAHV
jgi:colicin import membrane protein